jgi:hypothetical protein
MLHLNSTHSIVVTHSTINFITTRPVGEMHVSDTVLVILLAEKMTHEYHETTVIGVFQFYF